MGYATVVGVNKNKILKIGLFSICTVTVIQEYSINYLVYQIFFSSVLNEEETGVMTQFVVEHEILQIIKGY